MGLMDMARSAAAVGRKVQDAAKQKKINQQFLQEDQEKRLCMR